jgi:MFS superfamily sulfate permease-like transporter
MRKWLVLLLALAVLYVLPKINTSRSRRRFPLMKRINETVNILAAVLLVVYLAAFIYWLFTR